MKAISRIFVLSATTLALTVACVDENKKSEATKQNPGKTAPAAGTGTETTKVAEEAMQAARGETATPEELTNLSGNWRVESIVGDDASVNPLTAGKELGLPESKNIIQVQIEKERIKILHRDGDLTFFRADLGMKITGKLIESTDTSLVALPGLMFTMASKDKLTLKAYGALSTPAARLRKGSQNTAGVAAKRDIPLHTYELTRMNDADVVQPTENYIKMDFMLKAPNAQIATKLTGKAAPTPEQTGRLSCNVSKMGESQALRIAFYQREKENVPGHGILLEGAVKFDFSKESEQVSMDVLKKGPQTVIGQVEKDQRQNLLMNEADKCTVAINRQNRAITFALKCTGLSIADELKEAAQAPEASTAAKTLSAEENDLNAQQAELAEAEGTEKTEAEVKTDEKAEEQEEEVANARPSEIIFANGSCHMQAGRPL